ncbi:hypothetical protein [Nannocystis pusilla]|uniref:hypothetical protein n=1 Tax=Nannocystis pusilla TaxID=889268 RepID=UPI003B812C64
MGTTTITTAPPPTTGGTLQPTTTDGSASGDATMTGTTTTTVGVTSTGVPTSTGSTTEQVKFDLGVQPDGGSSGCSGNGGGGGMPEFSFIWIANSVEGTVSKIDTFTGVEVGRYVTGPDTSGLGDANNGPSRTSVNLYGDAAVANRNGGVTKIAARLEDCPDTNGNGVADTSTGPSTSRRGARTSASCGTTRRRPTRSRTRRARDRSRGSARSSPTSARPRTRRCGSAITSRARTSAPSSGSTAPPVRPSTWSTSRGAATPGPLRRRSQQGRRLLRHRLVVGPRDPDRPRHPRGHRLHQQRLPLLLRHGARRQGRAGVAGCDSNIYHLDPASQIWTVVGTGPGCMRGIMVDKMGRAFIAHNGSPAGMVVVDTDTKTLLNPNVPLPGAVTPVGISIDVEGYVWVVDQGGWAYKVDPETYQVILQVMGLNQPYTYSDMTGAGLDLVVNPQG